MSDAAKDSRIAVAGADESALESFCTAALGNLSLLFADLDRGALERAAAGLARARTVVVAGAHAAYPFALYLHHLAAGQFDNWTLAVRRGDGLSRFTAVPTSGDSLIAIAAAPYAAGTVELARGARRAGVHVVVVTDRLRSPLAACSNDVLIFPAWNPGVFGSHIGTVALAEMLVGMVAERSDGPPRGRGGHEKGAAAPDERRRR